MLVLKKRTGKRRVVFLAQRWLDARPTRNMTILARLSGVPYPTLRRVLDKENVPTLDTSLMLLNVLADADESIKIPGPRKECL